MTLTEFLLARIAEDEADANRQTWGQPIPVDSWGPDRILAECEVKRRIIALQGPTQFRRVPNDTILALALPYADHPDYRNEWKP